MVMLLWVRLCFLKTHIEALVPENITLARSTVFVDVIKVRWDHTGLRCPLSPMAGILIRRERFENTNETQGRSPYDNRGKDLEFCCHKARNTKDCWQQPETRRDKEGFFPGAFGGRVALWHLNLGQLASRTVEESLFQVTQFIIICYSCPKKLILQSCTKICVCQGSTEKQHQQDTHICS